MRRGRILRLWNGKGYSLLSSSGSIMARNRAGVTCIGLVLLLSVAWIRWRLRTSLLMDGSQVIPRFRRWMVIGCRISGLVNRIIRCRLPRISRARSRSITLFPGGILKLRRGLNWLMMLRLMGLSLTRCPLFFHGCVIRCRLFLRYRRCRRRRRSVWRPWLGMIVPQSCL